MKTIAFKEIGVPEIINIYTPKEPLPIFRYKRLQRILNGLKELEGVGDIVIYLIYWR